MTRIRIEMPVTGRRPNYRTTETALFTAMDTAAARGEVLRTFLYRGVQDQLWVWQGTSTPDNQETKGQS